MSLKIGANELLRVSISDEEHVASSNATILEKQEFFTQISILTRQRVKGKAR
jgi:hypothetical protein